jgi:AcrR family transcriptional regulator
VAQRRGEATREHLLDVAEQLFGERGVANVSLREIRLASGARNTAAMQFHFGDRDGLLEALTVRHVTRIGRRQEELWEAIVANGATEDPGRLVDVLVRPLAECLTLGPGERSWVKIMGELAAAPDVPLNKMIPITPAAGVEAGRALYRLMKATIPERVASERIFVAARIVVYMCADRARFEDDPVAKRRTIPVKLFSENLVDMVCGALFAPVSSPARPRSR